MNWNHTTQTSIEVTSSALARGAYGDPTPVPVTDAVEGVEIVPAAATGQYVSICNNGPSFVYARFGGTASPTNFSVIFPSGFNNDALRVAANEKLTVICPPGGTANLMVAIAPETEI